MERIEKLPRTDIIGIFFNGPEVISPKKSDEALIWGSELLEILNFSKRDGSQSIVWRFKRKVRDAFVESVKWLWVNF